MTENEQKEIEEDEQAQEKRDNRIAWIRFALIHVLVLIPAIIGIVCLVVGNKSDNDTLAFVGMLFLEAGVPAVMVILIIVVLTWKIRGIMKLRSDTTGATGNETTVSDETNGDEAEEETPSQREREQNAIAAVNSTRGFVSRANLSEYEAQNITEGMKNAPKWGLPVGIGIFLLLVADAVIATVLAIKEIFVGTIVCVALFAGFVITALIVMSVSRARATNGDIRKAKKITGGKVKACFSVGTSTTKSGGFRHNPGSGTVRIQSVTYRVIVISDGVEYGAFSKRFYETGETVTIAVMGKKRAKIVEDGELEKSKEE